MRNIAFALLSAAVAAFASAGEIVYEDPAARSGDVATPRVKLPGKGGRYFKCSFTARAFAKAVDGSQLDFYQGVFFRNAAGEMLPDCHDTLYQGEAPRRYERVLYAWDEVDTVELFFRRPWNLKPERGDTFTLEVSDIRIETATWREAAAYCDFVYARLPALDFNPDGDWTKLIPRTMEALRSGRPWRVVMLGDSIVQDTFNSQFHALVKRAFPKSNAEWIISMRGGTGCWHYILADNFYRHVVDHRPDLLLIGGISNSKTHNESETGREIGPTGPDAMLRVAKLARERLGCEVLIVNNALSVDFRPYDAHRPDQPLAKMAFDLAAHERVHGEELRYGELRDRCAAEGVQWWDAFLPCNRWLYASGLPHGFYSRDKVHSSELGKQLIGRVMLAYLTSGEGK